MVLLKVNTVLNYKIKIILKKNPGIDIPGIKTFEESQNVETFSRYSLNKQN
jgi:hypothetical protein